MKFVTNLIGKTLFSAQRNKYTIVSAWLEKDDGKKRVVVLMVRDDGSMFRQCLPDPSFSLEGL